MSMGLTLDSIRQILGRDVDEVTLTAAKANAMGLDSETIANNIGLERSEIEELMLGADYKDVRLLVGADMLKDRTERDTGWDGIESRAVQKLGRRVELENDTETLLKIAAVANRAQRRTAPPKEAGPLDPSQAGARIPLTLTKRYVEKLGADGTVERSETQQISVLNGSAINPKFEDIRNLLGGKAAEGTHGPGQRHDKDDDSFEELRAHAGRLIEERVTPAIEHAKGAHRNGQMLGDSDKPFSMNDLLEAARRKK